MKSFAAVAIATCALAASTASAAGADGAPWGYKPNDPSMAAPNQWADHYPTCGGQRQSPINIKTKTGYISEKRSLTFSGACADFNVSQSDESFTASVNGGSCAVTANGASEIVDWWVVKKPVDVSTADLARLQAQLRELHLTDDGKNARPVQPLNGRVVTALLLCSIRLEAPAMMA
eukprot:jgi/Phyca11/536566/estExt2_fgenesh1_pg.C_PHYCAscaffold_570016